MIRQEIVKLIEKAIKELQKGAKLLEFEIPEISVERPEEKTHGDYATNIALVIAKIVRKNPIEIANLLNLRFKAKGLGCFDKVEVAEPGFINFFISKKYLQKQVSEILEQKESFGRLRIGRGQKVNVEFISANPTGELHLGHGRGAFFGDALSNILEKAGCKVTREYYINNAPNSAQIKELGKTALGEGITYLNEYLKEKIQISKTELPFMEAKVKKRTKSSSPSKNQNDDSKFKNNYDIYGQAGYLLAQEVQKDIRDFIENNLKIKFDNWVSEQDLYKNKKVDKIYDWLKNKNLIYKKEGAEWLKTSSFGDKQDWVVVRETGEPTYLLSDIAYHKDKLNRGFQKIINIWGADHQGHVGKMKAVAKILNYRGDLDILISQVVRLKKGKISKRKGEVVTLDWLLNEVGLDSARFFYLMKSLNTQMEFNVELAKERSVRSPVYYVQYAYARIHSILAKSKVKSQKSKLQLKTKNLKLIIHSSELNLIKQLIRFPEIVVDTAKDYQVQRLPQYAIDLAAVFHQFYRDCQVISEDKDLTQARLALISATKIVLKNTSDLMGISAPEKM